MISQNLEWNSVIRRAPFQAKILVLLKLCLPDFLSLSLILLQKVLEGMSIDNIHKCMCAFVVSFFPLSVMETFISILLTVQLCASQAISHFG